MQTNMDKPDKEHLTPAGRAGEAVVIAALLLMSGFFWLHQSAHTGFFTAGFGTLEMVCLYGPIVIALVPPVIRAVTGRRNPARLPEAIANASLGLGTLWLLISFPLDFSHLGDVLPAPTHFLFAWVTNDLGRILMIFQIVLMPISAGVNIGKYFSVRQQETEDLPRQKMA